jgi:hypothetical protein
MDLYRIIALQATVHMAGPGAGIAGDSGLFSLVEAIEPPS